MTDHHIQPDRITKPIQLLAAWLVGLFSVNSTFLFAATRLPHSGWEASALVIAAIANVPIFLIALFVLQTKFRPELQEDSYYSSYLSSKTNQVVAVTRVEVEAAERALKLVEAEAPSVTKDAGDDILSRLTYGICKFLPDREQIVERLTEVGVISYSSFGGDAPPKDRAFSISRHLPKEVVDRVVIFARDLGFTGYKFYDNVIEDSMEDVLFGSYGKPEFEIARKIV